MGILKRIKELDGDLTEMIIIEPEDDTIHPNPANPCAPWIYPHRYAEIRVNSNTKVREAAAEKLREIYDTSKWYNFIVKGRIKFALSKLHVGGLIKRYQI